MGTASFTTIDTVITRKRKLEKADGGQVTDKETKDGKAPGAGKKKTVLARKRRPPAEISTTTRRAVRMVPSAGSHTLVINPNFWDSLASAVQWVAWTTQTFTRK